MYSTSMERWSPEQINELDKVLKLKFMSQRLETFNSSLHDVLSLSQSGFYETDEFFECFCCGFRVSKGVIPNEDHQTIARYHAEANIDCSYLIGLEPNLQMRYEIFAHNQYITYNSNPKQNEIAHRYSLRAIISAPHRIPLYIPTATLKKEGEEIVLMREFTRRKMNTEKIYKLFQLRMNREYSFRTTDLQVHIRNAFIDAGFFHTGIRMVVQCAFCRISYSGHATRHPMMMHRLISPHCPFLINESFDIDRNLCHICFDVSQEVVYLPCRHLVACNECDVKMTPEVQEMQKCPICREQVKNKIRVIRV